MATRVPNQIGAAFALSAFAVSIGSGLIVDVQSSVVLIRSLVVLVCAYPTGWVLGRVAQVVLNEHLTALKEANPIPSVAPIAPAEDEVLIVDEVTE